MHSVIFRLLAALLTGTLASCMPAPHVAYLRPAASGLLLENGQPIPGAELFLSNHPGDNEPCSAKGEPIPVSPEGMFAWTSVQERKLMDSVIDPVAVRGSLTVLCIRHATSAVRIGAVIFMKQSAPLALRLACDTARPRRGPGGPHVVSAMLGQAQYCEAIVESAPAR